MTLRRKNLLIIGATLLIATLFTYLASRFILLNGFIHVEDQDTRQNVQRVFSMVSGKLKALKSPGLDWARWDDTYTFVQDGNESYIRSNIVDATFVTNAVSFIVYVNKEGRVVFAKGFDLPHEKAMPVPPGLFQRLSSDSPLLNHRDAAGVLNEDGIDGVIMLPEGPAFIVAAPILTSKREGPPQGSFIWGRFLYPTEIESLAESSQLSLNVYQFNNSSLPVDVQAAHARLSAQSPWWVAPLNEQVVAGYGLINDIYGQPALILKAEMPRHIYAQGQASLSYFLIALVVIGCILTAVVMVVSDKLVIARLTKLSASVTKIRETDDLAIPIEITGQDELSSLAAGMRAMLDALARSRKKLQEAHDGLEKRVQERTAELTIANTLLQEEIAERKEAQAELALARDQAVESLRLKTQILANISHDARTPLNVIMLRGESLRCGRHGTVSEAQLKALESIQANSQQLLGFINNLLDEAQLGASKTKLAQSKLAPTELLADIVNSMMPLAERKGLHLKAECVDEIPHWLYGDPARLKQILSNLIDNAIKFTAQGQITVRTGRVDDKHWMFQVSDTGLGIPAEVQDHIFEAFWQADGSITRTINRGVGLGLSIVKQLVTLMRGQITVQSELGSGSTFTVVLPIEMAQEGEDYANMLSPGR